MTGWNYRWFRTKDGVALHEVYYDEANRPTSMTAEPILTCDSVEDAKRVLRWMQDGLDKPLLDEGPAQTLGYYPDVDHPEP